MHVDVPQGKKGDCLVSLLVRTMGQYSGFPDEEQ